MRASAWIPVPWDDYGDIALDHAVRLRCRGDNLFEVLTFKTLDELAKALKARRLDPRDAGVELKNETARRPFNPRERTQLWLRVQLTRLSED